MLFSAEAKRDHCNKTVDIYEDVSSPEVTAETFGKPMTCSYRFRSFRGTPKDWILRIRFKKFKVGTLVNATTCHMGYMQVSAKLPNNICMYVCMWCDECDMCGGSGSYGYILEEGKVRPVDRCLLSGMTYCCKQRVSLSSAFICIPRKISNKSYRLTPADLLNLMFRKLNQNRV